MARAGHDLLTASRTIAPVLADQAETHAEADDRGGYAGQLGEQLAIVARLIQAGLPTRVYSVSLGGFDTHASEKFVHTQLLRELDTSLGRFLDDIARHPRGATSWSWPTASSVGGWQPTPRAAPTTAPPRPVFVLGPRVKGGTFYGEEPSLADLDDGDLKLTTDFRSVYATLLEGIVGFDARRALGRRFPVLDLL